jgi:hypothetical protein
VARQDWWCWEAGKATVLQRPMAVQTYRCRRIVRGKRASMQGFPKSREGFEHLQCKYPRAMPDTPQQTLRIVV